MPKRKRCLMRRCAIDMTLRLLRESGQAPEEMMGFHAQQACEKLIKAVLVMHGVVFERTHDLAALAALCDAHGVPAPADRNALRILNNFAVRFRYDTCPAALIDIVATSSLVETLTEWATREIASS
ncbi:HEPN domain-containing protein [uncultured Thiohalocapsa sp.]|uniref:HEPN domain-containing protein n=1 Tax=uncultured Thiohalocapsa sp. TaxID=768990 RepID=UPI0025F86FE6|nr:HEPN domain-containing protein [uncultured Thiohalocapsa sp.]